jgi:chromosome segregation ATPase
MTLSDSPSPSDADREALAAAVEEMRAELRRVGAEIVEQAAAHAQRAAGGVAETAAEAHRALASGLDEARRAAQLGGERATQALAQGADLERRAREVETVVADLRATVPQATAEAFEGLAAVREELEELSERLAACEERQASRGGLGGVLACVRDEIVAAVMTIVSLGAVFGRLALSVVR